MTLQIKDGLYIDLLINDVPVQFNVGDFDSIVITSNVWSLLPSLRIRFTDRMSKIIKGNSLADGTKITLKIGNGESIENLRDINFRTLSVPKQLNNNDGIYYEVYGVYDAIPFIKSIPKVGAYSGSSRSVLETLASECGLTFNGTETSDEMKWMRGRMNYGQFARHISDHGYSSERSCMLFGVTTNGELRYVDLNNRQNDVSKPYNTFAYDVLPGGVVGPQQQFYPVYKYTKEISSGLSNLNYGYKYVLGQDKMDGTREEQSSLKFDKNLSSRLEVNSQIKDQVGTVRSGYIGPDIGNTHANFAKARHQNLRFRAMYSSHMRVITDTVTTDDLFDLVTVSIMDQAEPLQTDLRLDVIYMVMGKSQMISGTRYFEKVWLSTTGKEQDLSPELL